MDSLHAADTGEVEKLRKDRDQGNALLQQMQKDLSDKNAQMASIRYENLQLKKEVQQKDVELAAMHTKAARLRDMKKLEDEFQSRENELVALRQKFKAAESRVQELLEKIQQMTEELDRQRAVTEGKESAIRSQKGELDQNQASLTEMRRVERDLLAEHEKTKKIHQHFRTRILQLISSLPG